MAAGGGTLCCSSGTVWLFSVIADKWWWERYPISFELTLSSFVFLCHHGYQAELV